jgi:hypothetical protein
MPDNLIIYPFNLLGESGVTVTAYADAAYPKGRLYDRSIDFYWQYTATGAFVLSLDQGASFSKYVDFLAICNHNFSGATIDWQYSSNGSAWVNAVAQWSQSGNAQVVKTLTTPLLYRYWRISVGSIASPRCTELYMSLGYPFRIVWDSNPTSLDKDNVEWIPTIGSLERSVKMGAVRKSRRYPLFHHQTAESTMTNFDLVTGYMDNYSKPFFVKDHDSNYWLARFESISEVQYNSKGMAFRDVSLVEML